MDVAGVHTSRYTLDWLESKGVPRLAWSAKSPDLNPIEKVWAALVRIVYAGYKQYETVRDLKEAIIKGWARLSEEYLEKLVLGMPRRCIAVIMADGGATKN